MSEDVFIWILAVVCGGLLLATPELVYDSGRHQKPLRTRQILKGLGLALVGLGVTVCVFWLFFVVIDIKILLNDPEKQMRATLGFAVTIFFVIIGLLEYAVASTIGTTLSKAEERSLAVKTGILKIIGWPLFVVPFLVVAVPVFMSTGLGVVLIISGITIAFSNRRANQATLLWLLAIAVKKNLPLVAEIEAFASGFRGLTRQRLDRLADLLRQGVPLATALDQIPKLVPRFAVTAAHVGTKSGTLGDTLREAAIYQTYEKQRMPPGVTTIGGLATYLMVLMCVGGNILFFLCYWIVPKFNKIFQSFNTELPQVSILVIRFADFLVNYFYLVFPLAVLVFMTLGRMMGMSYLPRLRLFRFLEWPETPWILRNLAVTVAARRPLPEGLKILAEEHQYKDVRKQLTAVNRAVGEGADCWDSFARAGLLRNSDAAVLQAAQRVGNLPWALRELAEATERRFTYRIAAWMQGVEPAIVIFAGFVVLMFCSAFFMPLVKLVNDLSKELEL